jgi:hypothetical protein
LGLQWPFMLTGAIVLAVASAWGVIIFSASEKDLLRAALARRIRSPRPNR